MNNNLTFQEAKEIISQIEKNDSRDPLFQELFGDFLRAAKEYTEMRFEWHFMSLEDTKERDAYRTTLHNTFIGSLNILTKYLQKQGIDTSWRESLGSDRKRIGDLANLIVSIIAIRNR